MPDQAPDPAAEWLAFVEAVDDTPPDAVSACRGWTTHEIVAHLTSGADSFAAQVEAHLDGASIPEFGAEEVREPPYRAIDDADLRRRLVRSVERMTAAFDAALEVDPGLQRPDIAWGIPVASLATHMRQEFAIHRWDLIGDDDRGAELLAKPEFVAHSVRWLGDSLLGIGLARDPRPREPMHARIRVANQPDLILDVTPGPVGRHSGRLQLDDPADTGEIIETDAASRLLMLWGRRSGQAHRTRSHVTPDVLGRIQTVLSGW